jgi:hypothetical protein
MKTQRANIEIKEIQPKSRVYEPESGQYTYITNPLLLLHLELI